ncbi:tRNA (adenine(22)-N(1))-methyltransferase TrmK [Nicoliella spurrieriana]|uniref:tRNA (Adenine(22)-N(1))-methyltransferase TrmK n=1 Tax=Nicoliella spurrieriana TaxID=2925830 RepID=A0A976RRH0_9LACO|nr:tRNA (adenine(22)-N(1))-methyltransferase TrmK [Nicoliella spurrieriana]UQS86547.1 tRNA (adenine(22)-N(1))-methyltransferase TrmK [Nicoliella spurrieriana]
MDGNNLSQRLMTVAQYVKSGSRLADIGSDHGYLPIYLAKTGQVSFAIAGEVALGPLSNAEHEIKVAGLSDIIMPRLADGLAAIEPTDNIDTITIAGMGGGLITRILEQGRAKLTNLPDLILQPNVDAIDLRKWLVNNHYQIANENILKEDAHIYEVIHATRADRPVQYSPLELMFGPHLIVNQNTAFVEKWQGKIKRLRTAITQMQSAKVPPIQRIANLNDEINTIQEVLDNARN